MQRVTITIDDDLLAEVDQFMTARGYANRSEAIRDLARSGLQQAATEVDGARSCIAALVYVYDHAKRELPRRLTLDYHERHDLAQATLHVHLDHDSCLEVTVLKGRRRGAAIRRPCHRRTRRAPRASRLFAGGRRAYPRPRPNTKPQPERHSQSPSARG